MGTRMGAVQGSVTLERAESLRKVSATMHPLVGSAVEETKVIKAFGADHGFPVRNGLVLWGSMVERLEQLRAEALASGG